MKQTTMKDAYGNEARQTTGHYIDALFSFSYLSIGWGYHLIQSIMNKVDGTIESIVRYGLGLKPPIYMNCEYLYLKKMLKTPMI